MLKNVPAAKATLMNARLSIAVGNGDQVRLDTSSGVSLLVGLADTWSAYKLELA